jgi:hypothetical protein
MYMMLGRTWERKRATPRISPPPPPTSKQCYGPAEFRPLDGHNGASLHPQWEDLHDKAGALWWLKFLVVT